MASDLRLSTTRLWSLAELNDWIPKYQFRMFDIIYLRKETDSSIRQLCHKC